MGPSVCCIFDGVKPTLPDLLEVQIGERFEASILALLRGMPVAVGAGANADERGNEDSKCGKCCNDSFVHV